jgi:hypothetical protein
LEPVELFSTGPTGLVFLTGPDRPVGIFDLTGEKPAKNWPVL